MTDDLRHGGALDLVQARFPDAPKPWIDLSTGINPWPYPDVQVSDRARQQLPTQSDYQRCRNAMATAINAPDDSLLLAPGSELLIRLLPTVLPAKVVAVQAPSYGDHADIWQATGADVIYTRTPLNYADQADVVVLCHPNNPDGRFHLPEHLVAAHTILARRSRWLIVDEAYADLCPDLSLAPQGGQDGLIVLRSFGKFYGLAGIRLGGMIAPPSILSAMRQKLGVWPVSGVALEIATRAYLDTDWQAQTRKQLAKARQGLDQILDARAAEPVTGTDLFRFVKTDQNAYDLWTQLAQAGLYVRRFAWSDEHLRIGHSADAAALRRLDHVFSL